MYVCQGSMFAKFCLLICKTYTTTNFMIHPNYFRVVLRKQQREISTFVVLQFKFHRVLCTFGSKWKIPLTIKKKKKQNKTKTKKNKTKRTRNLVGLRFKLLIKAY